MKEKTMPRIFQTPAAAPAVAARHFAARLALETDASDLHEALEAGAKNLVVIDGRSPEAFKRRHIQGAINLWHREIDAKSTAAFDKHSLYVSYCTGVGCNASAKAALKLARLGFKVKELSGGLKWWKWEGYPTAKGKSKSKKKSRSQAKGE